ncbi:hypothetical protein ACHAWO_002150 [Cyclotella atomus]|uniref:Uncharacterized protein n=1 Tax=Cyclotella atomus TaxID=382360 RepID=A0ABD3QPD4_9STRA
MDRATKKWFFILIGNGIALRLVYNAQQVANSPGPSRDLEFLPSKVHHVSSVKPSAFHQIANEVYTHDVCNENTVSESHTTKEFDLDSWRPFQTGGGLDDNDRKMLARYYGSANSVFEWGLGESSYMAGHFNVSRYAGVDSEAEWVSNARDKCPSHFRLSFADIGRTHNFGRPLQDLKKNQYDYVIAPLVVEQCPFDVYLVDGRFRVACGLLALLHSSRGGHNATILVHDFESPHKIHSSYKELLRVCDKIEFSGSRLAALKRKADVTDEMIHDMYLEWGHNSA